MKRLLTITLAALLSACTIITEPPVIEPPTPKPPVVEPPIVETVGVPYTAEHVTQGRPTPLEWEPWMEVPIVTGTTTYICSTNGDDSNPGTVEQPLKTYDAFMEQFKLLKAGDAIRFCRGGQWEITERLTYRAENSCSKDSFCLIGAYGEGAVPYFKYTNQYSTIFEGKVTDPIEGIYWMDMEWEGTGWATPNGTVWGIWDDVQYMVWNNVYTHNTGLGYNLSAGRTDDGLVNSHFAILNSRQEWNASGGILASSGDVFIDYNISRYNAKNGRGHNYYLSGEMDGSGTGPVTLQRSISRFNSPWEADPSSPSCDRGPLVTHGIFKGLNIIDNDIQEEVGSSMGGCWGYGHGGGRTVDQGIESLANLVVSGNIGIDTGNLGLGAVNATDALIGWNYFVGYPSDGGDFKRKGYTGIRIPSNGGWDEENPTLSLRVVYNKIDILSTGTQRWGTGIEIGSTVEDLELEYNEVNILGDLGSCYLVSGVKLEESQLGTNTCNRQ